MFFCIILHTSLVFFFFFSSRRRHTRCLSDWSSDVCSSDLHPYSLQSSTVPPVLTTGGGGTRNGKQRKKTQNIYLILKCEIALDFRLLLDSQRLDSVALLYRSEERRVGKECSYSQWTCH